MGDLEAVRNGGGVETLGHKFSSGLEESASHDDHGCGAITSLDILSLGDLNEL